MISGRLVAAVRRTSQPQAHRRHVRLDVGHVRDQGPVPPRAAFAERRHAVEQPQEVLRRAAPPVGGDHREVLEGRRPPRVGQKDRDRPPRERPPVAQDNPNRAGAAKEPLEGRRVPIEAGRAQGGDRLGPRVKDADGLEVRVAFDRGGGVVVVHGAVGRRPCHLTGQSATAM